MKPKIADNIDAGIDSNGNLHFIFVNSRTDLVVEADPLTVKLVERMDGTQTIGQITELFENDIDETEVRDLVAFLLENQVVRDATSSSSLPTKLAAFARQVQFFTDFATDPIHIQKLLGASKVGIVGLGTIGGMIASQLVRMGVNHIQALDSDNVTESNIARHALFTHTDIGLSKVEATRRSLNKIRSGVEFDGWSTTVESEKDVFELAKTCNIVINCADQPNVAQTSEWVGNACMQTETPHILAGGYRTHLGFLGPTVIPFESACWKCFSEDYRNNDPFGKLGWRPLTSSRATGGSLMPLAGMVASVHVWETIRILTGLLSPLMTNRKAEIDFLEFGISWYEVDRGVDCPVCRAGEVESNYN